MVVPSFGLRLRLAERALVKGEPVLERPVEGQTTLLEHAHAMTECADGGWCMRDEDNRLAVVEKLPQRVDAALLEIGIADGEDFIKQQNVWIELGRDRKAESHVHSRRVVL